MVSKGPAAYLAETANGNSGNEIYYRKTGCIENIRLDDGDKRDWCCLDGSQARGNGSGIHVDAFWGRAS